jgi:hypothetical protein
MAAVVFSLLLALGAFLFALWPLFGERESIPDQRPPGLLKEAVARSARELETDLKLEKIREEDLEVILRHLEKESVS